jgi:transcriptional regulator with XRE-family HTH domain
MNRFKELTKLYGHTLKEISEGSGVPYTTLCDWSRGASVTPKAITVYKVAQYFKLPMELFIDLPTDDEDLFKKGVSDGETGLHTK